MPQIIYAPEFISDFESVGSYGYALLYDYNEELNRISVYYEQNFRKKVDLFDIPSL